ncbi:oligosaccharide flippase family protein [Aliivibrio fischeri]|uniref:oligosaccharide flippase family protein n=1 Tax=Aliivibrio fischeri TaxID=668 RepID=UPI00080E3005|nr:oligosaccharide flippase family protein [Aliivibrio fischeri]OCH04144.1 hypothetical protein A6E10_02405 [Aliivibrio fischeri]
MSLKKNIIGLGVAQLFNYLLPFIQYPYLTRVLGTESFGLIMYACSIIVMMQVITDYGLEVYLTKKITDEKKSAEVLGQYLFESLVLKLLLLVLSLPLFFFIYINTILFNYPTLSLFIVFTMIVNALNPLWLYQGLEKTYIYAKTVITFKITTLFFVFLLVKNENDYLLYLIVFFFSSFFTILTLYIIIFLELKITPIRVAFSNVISLIISGFEYFISRAGATLYITGCSVFLGSFSDLHQVALYSSAEKLYIAGCGIFSPIITAFIPYMNRTKDYNLFYKVSILIFLISFIGVFMGFIFGEDILNITFGEDLILAKDTLNVLLIALSFSIMGMMFGYPALMPIGLVKYANLSVLLSGCIQVGLFLIIILFGISITSFNIAITFLISTMFTFFYRFFFFVKYNLKARNEVLVK